MNTPRWVCSRALDWVLQALAQDLQARGDIDLLECFISAVKNTNLPGVLGLSVSLENCLVTNHVLTG
jgi:hypothetical protein